ncbi:C-C motif chemokine 3-like [Trichomycterus rosablanca]|uniref:C-C motif chemokine 3-like n=1 Tax=Trichomycterus rosablanca TaxID=2290929 RepID=UPI002F35BDD4
MFSTSGSLLLVLLVLGCLQSYTDANMGAKTPQECCFDFYKKAIPATYITEYEVTRDDCTKSGVIFITRKKARVCADPGFRWVKRAIEVLDKRMYETST